MDTPELESLLHWSEFIVLSTGAESVLKRLRAGVSAIEYRYAPDASDVEQTLVPLLARKSGRSFDADRPPRLLSRIDLSPGASSIIPGRAEILFQFRDISTEILERLQCVLKRGVQESNRRELCTAKLEVVSQSRPALCDSTFQVALADAAQSLASNGWQYMPSGAGQDCQYVSQVMPAAMIFVPFIGGVSHLGTEDTKREDLVMGLRASTEGARLLFPAKSP